MPPFLTETLPGIWRYGTWPMFIQLADEGHEIASHTMNHFYLTSLPVGDTVTEGTALVRIISVEKANRRKNSRIIKCITLAYPYSDRNTVY
jgi:peptidoglycan/xylan/chitin deacetylase (PgdA/CDA1 family)